MVSLLMELYIGNENYTLILCEYMAGFRKAGHIGRGHEGSRDLQDALKLTRFLNSFPVLRHHCSCGPWHSTVVGDV